MAVSQAPPAGRDASRQAGVPSLSSASFARLARYIQAELGIRMPESKTTMVQSRLLRRVRQLGLASTEDYCEYFFNEANIEERDHFINVITTNKTEFFREADHFEYLTSAAIPTLRRERGSGAVFKVWSAGCSSGEEPYTLAMVLSEYAGAAAPFDFAILATDISTKVLDHARAGIYPEAQILPVPPELRKKHLLRGRNGAHGLVRIAPELRRKVAFHRLNFMDDNYGVRDMFDAIFFRNVMIYFDRPTQESVINKLCRHLVPGGYLFLGHSESLVELNVPLRPVHTCVLRKVNA